MKINTFFAKTICISTDIDEQIGGFIKFMEIIQRIHFKVGNDKKNAVFYFIIIIYRNLFFQQLDTSAYK